MNDSVEIAENVEESRFNVLKKEILEGSAVCGMMLKEVDLKRFHCMVISIQRDCDFIANPPADWCFRPGDIVWFAGETALLGKI